MPKSARKAEELDLLGGYVPEALPEYAPPPVEEPQQREYPDWLPSVAAAAGWTDLRHIDELIDAGFDISTPEAFQSAVQQNESGKAAAARDQGRNDQFGNDMAWLDPAFQREAATVRPTTTADALQFGTTADPEAEARQASLLQNVLGRGVTADAATEASQRGFLGELEGRGTTADPAAEAAQRELLGEVAGRGRTSDADSEEAQQYALDELFGLYRQGGQGAQDKAARAAARADSENWLKGQREADIQDRAERGMSGSGGEVLDLLADRQAAASRLSSADLEASAAAEKRALDALMGGSQLATGMRGASDAYQAENTRARAGVAGDMRASADAYEGANDRTRGQTMESMRSSADQFSVNNDRTAADLASGMREASDRFVGDNADRLGDAASFNANAINDAAESGRQFLRDAYADTMDRRDAWDRGLLDLQTGIATGTRAHDASQNTQGWNQGMDVAATDTRATNNALDNYNSGEMSTWLGGQPGILAADDRSGQATQDIIGGAIDSVGESAKMVTNAMGAGGGGAMGGMGAMGGAGANQAPTPARSGIVDPWDERYG